MELMKDYHIEKRNDLNEMRSSQMTVQELRFFGIYLSRINARDIKTRIVRFSVEDFCKIMGFGRPDIQKLKATTDSLLVKLVHIPLASGGFKTVQLFKECTVDKDENGKWYVEIDAHDKVLPLMFDLKNYFTYDLWNILRLKSTNQIRMYEILKQRERFGTVELSLKELRELLGIAPDEYVRWDNFKKRVLDACQEALRKNTDICFTYEKGKIEQSGTCSSVIFRIKENTEYDNPLSLEEFINKRNSARKAKDDLADSSDGKAEMSDTEFLAAHYFVIKSYREHADPRMTDRGIVAFDDMYQRYYPSFGISDLDLDMRITGFIEIQAQALAKSKGNIQNFDSYILTCLKNQWHST